MRFEACWSLIFAVLSIALTVSSIGSRDVGLLAGVQPDEGQPARTQLQIATLSQSTFQTWALDLIVSLHKSTESCGYGNITINNQVLPQIPQVDGSIGSGAITTVNNDTIDASWTFNCITSADSSISQLLRFKISSVNGVLVEDSGFSLFFTQFGKPSIIKGVVHNSQTVTTTESIKLIPGVKSAATLLLAHKPLLISTLTISVLLFITSILLCYLRSRRSRKLTSRRNFAGNAQYQRYHDLEKADTDEKDILNGTLARTPYTDEESEDEFDGFKRAVELVDSMIADQDSRASRENRAWTSEEGPPAYCLFGN